MGRWGTGLERRQKLEAAGYDYAAVQKMVNDLLSDSAQIPVSDTGKFLTVTVDMTEYDGINLQLKGGEGAR